MPTPGSSSGPESHTPDPHHLQRFLDAQDPVYPQVLAELAAGHKRSHWMWFIFPQLHGLGSSPTAQHFALRSLGEARAYLAHPTLGPRLQECTALTLRHPHRTASDLFPFPDDLKFHSSLTLFAQAAGPTHPRNPAAQPGPAPPADPAGTVFAHALATFFRGAPDPATLRLLHPA